MAEKRTSTFNYDFNWEIEDFTTRRDHYSNAFCPLKGKIPIFDPITQSQVNNPIFTIICYNEGRYHEKKVFRFYLTASFHTFLEDFRIQCRIVARSVPSGCAEYSNNETHDLVKNKELLLCTIVTKGETLRIADQVIRFSREHDFIGLKFHFKIFFTDPVFQKSIITPAVKVPRERGFNLCMDFKNLYVSKEMADINITIGDDSLLAHKLVLVTRSPVFKAMMDNDCLESNTKTIQITDADASVFDRFLKYIYCCEIGDKSYDIVRNLYVLADKYAVDGLKEDCRDILEAELNESTVCQLLEMAHMFTDEILKGKAVEFVKRNFSAVSCKPEWIKMCKDNPEMASDVLRMVTSFLDKSKEN